MRRRDFLQQAGVSAVAFGVLRSAGGCRTVDVNPSGAPSAFSVLRDGYFVRTLELNPVESTYLGGDGYDPALRSLNGRLRDFRPEAIAAEVTWLQDIEAALAMTTVSSLSTAEQIDHRVMSGQVRYLRHMLVDRRYQQRAVDTYSNEPFRGVDWQLQQMVTVDGGLGTDGEWADVIDRVTAIPAYLEAAMVQLRAGVAAGNLPDHRLVQKDGIKAAHDADAYFRTELPALARTHLAGRALAATVEPTLRAAGAAAADAFAAFGTFLSTTYTDTVDRFAVGEAEYTWRVRHCLLDARTTDELYAYGAAEIARYQALLFVTAAEVATGAGLALPFGSDADKRASTRAVMIHLEKDAPENDDTLFAWYRACIARCVSWGREHAMFDIPDDYQLDVLPTPPILRGGGGASYFAAPTYKTSGVGRFYLDPTDDDPAQLAANNRATIADTAVHEGFPGHDWHYKFMAQHARTISNVRWLSAGSVEDSFSMWADSMAAEGWGLYAEDLMAEPTPDHPHGVYSAAEHLVELQWQVIRAVRVRVDVGLHTGQLSFDEAVDVFAAEGAFYPGARAAADNDPAARAILDNASGQVERYAKWPTQAITYNLGQAAIVALREADRKKRGSAFSAKNFHERFMTMGTIPAGCFKDVF